MTQIKIKISNIDEAKALCHAAAECAYKIDISNGRYEINAKSIMDVFTIELNTPVAVRIHSDSCDEFLNEIKDFIEE